MALSAGTRLGVYEVVGLIGQGGMGEVYQARDTKLDRDVALKVLPEAFTADPDRLARFEREASGGVGRLGAGRRRAVRIVPNACGSRNHWRKLICNRRFDRLQSLPARGARIETSNSSIQTTSSSRSPRGGRGLKPVPGRRQRARATRADAATREAL